MVERMTNDVGVDYVHDSVWSTPWTMPMTSVMGTNVWARGNIFLGGQSSIECLSVCH